MHAFAVSSRVRDQTLKALEAARAHLAANAPFEFSTIFRDIYLEQVQGQHEMRVGEDWIIVIAELGIVYGAIFFRIQQQPNGHQRLSYINVMPAVNSRISKSDLDVACKRIMDARDGISHNRTRSRSLMTAR